MSDKDLASLSEAAKTQLIYSYAALLLSDSKAEISEANLEKILKGTNNKVNKSWSVLLSKSLKGKNVNDYLSVGGGSGGDAGGKPAETANKKDEKKEVKKEEPKKKEKAPEPEPEEEGDFGLDLFG